MIVNEMLLKYKNIKINKLKICIFGSYKREYPRNQILLKGLLQNHCKIIEINQEIPNWLKPSPWKYFIRILTTLIKQTILFKRVQGDYYCVLVLYPGQLAVLLARLLTKKPVIYDPFISIYESNVRDYQSFPEKSIIAKMYYYLEYHAFHAADMIISDTIQHQNLYQKLFRVQKPINRLFVGADNSIFLKQKKKDGLSKSEKDRRETRKFVVGFIGTYIPLQGIPYIIESASLLGEYQTKIQYRILGGSRKQQQPMKNLVKRLKIQNVEFEDPIPFTDLTEWVAQTDLQLGIFGNSAKTQRVIPNKAFYALAARKPLLTADTPAIRELLTPGENVFVCPTASPKAIADAIISIYKTPTELTRIENNGYKRYLESCTPQIIGKQLIAIMEKSIKHKR